MEALRIITLKWYVVMRILLEAEYYSSFFRTWELKSISTSEYYHI